MYTYKRATGVNQLYPRGQEILDISSTPTRELATTYSSLTLVVLDGLVNKEVAIDATLYYEEFKTFTGAIQAWLNTKATTVLQTSNKLPGTDYRYVTTHDIQYRWFTPVPGDVRITEDRQDMLTKGSARDIRISKTDKSYLDYDLLVNSSLWTINGHLVRGISAYNSIFLVGAGNHWNVNDNSHINCLNFHTVSTLKTYPITDDMVDVDDYGSYRNVHVKSPVSLKGKTVWMSIGGRFAFSDMVVENSEFSVTVQTERVDWFTRIFDSKELIDLSTVINSERNVVPNGFFSNADFFKRLLTDNSSFLIVLDNPNLDVTHKPINTYNFPFTYHTEEKGNIPLLTGNGLLPKYYTRKIINRRLLDIDIGIRKRYLNHTTGVNNEGNLYHGFTNRYSPSKLHQGYLLYIRAVAQGNQ